VPVPLYDVAHDAWKTMRVTEYAHHYRVRPRQGVYRFDCVGMVDAFLRMAAPDQWGRMHARLHIRRGYVPNPGKLYRYAARTWTGVHPRAIARGDLLVLPRTRTYVGHAMIAAGRPRPLRDGGVALKVLDATGSPHGPDDTRRWDARAVRGSGLGMGTVEIRADGHLAWHVGGKRMRAPLLIARLSSTR
jgi:hypothetical protein